MLDKVFPRSCLSLLVFVPEVIKVLIINLKKEFNQVGFLGFNLSPNNYPAFIFDLAGTSTLFCSVKQNRHASLSV